VMHILRLLSPLPLAILREALNPPDVQV